MNPTTPEIMENQTQFAEEQPLLEAEHIPTSATPSDISREKPKHSIKKIALFGSLAFLFLILILAIAMRMTMRREGLRITELASPSPIAEKQVPSQLQQTLDLLHEDVEKADPSRNDLPFPPISFEIYIQKPQR